MIIYQNVTFLENSIFFINVYKRFNRYRVKNSPYRIEHVFLLKFSEIIRSFDLYSHLLDSHLEGLEPMIQSYKKIQKEFYDLTSNLFEQRDENFDSFYEKLGEILTQIDVSNGTATIESSTVFRLGKTFSTTRKRSSPCSSFPVASIVERIETFGTLWKFENSIFRSKRISSGNRRILWKWRAWSEICKSQFIIAEDLSRFRKLFQFTIGAERRFNSNGIIRWSLVCRNNENGLFFNGSSHLRWFLPSIYRT